MLSCTSAVRTYSCGLCLHTSAYCSCVAVAAAAAGAVAGGMAKTPVCQDAGRTLGRRSTRAGRNDLDIGGAPYSAPRPSGVLDTSP